MTWFLPPATAGKKKNVKDEYMKYEYINCSTRSSCLWGTFLRGVEMKALTVWIKMTEGQKMKSHHTCVRLFTSFIWRISLFSYRVMVTAAAHIYMKSTVNCAAGSLLATLSCNRFSGKPARLTSAKRSSATASIKHIQIKTPVKYILIENYNI